MQIEPIPGEPTRWTVQSESRAGMAFIVDSDYYTGRADGCRWACGCERFMANAEICKHIRATRAAYPTGRHSLTYGVS